MAQWHFVFAQKYDDDVHDYKGIIEANSLCI
jgi:hypothetical protein